MMHTYNQRAASSLLSQQYNAALGYGKEISFLSCCFYFICSRSLLTVSFLHTIRASRHPSQKSSHGGAGRPDGTSGRRCPEKRRRFNASAGPAACPANPALGPRRCPGSEGEHAHRWVASALICPEIHPSPFSVLV